MTRAAVEKLDVMILDVKRNGTFIEQIERVPRQHSGWESIFYQGHRYQLFGGIRTVFWINIAVLRK